MKKLNFSYRASVEPETTLSEKTFPEAWAQCGGKYPFTVMAIDSSVNANDWQIPADKLSDFASGMRGLQLRKDHGDSVDDVVGLVVTARYDEAAQRVFAEGWTDDEKLARKIHHRTVQDVSMQARADDVICGNCGVRVDECRCDNQWRSLLDPRPVEMSFVAEGAYAEAGLVAGFYAALDTSYQEMNNMSDEKLDKLESELASLKQQFKAMSEVPDTPHPVVTDNNPQKGIPSEKPGSEVVPQPPQDKAAAEDDKDKKIKELEAKLSAMEDKLKDEKSAKAEMDSEDEKDEKAQDETEKDEKAGITTSASFQSRRSQPFSGSSSDYKASGAGNMKRLTGKDFKAALDAGKDPYAGQPTKPRSHNVAYVQEAVRRGYDEDSANLMADIHLANAILKNKTTVQHVYKGGQ